MTFTFSKGIINPWNHFLELISMFVLITYVEKETFWKEATTPTWKLCVLKHHSAETATIVSNLNEARPVRRPLLINVCLFNFRFSLLHTHVYINPQSYVSIRLSLHPSLHLSPGLFILDFLRKNLQWNENKGSFTLIIFGVESNLFSFY